MKTPLSRILSHAAFCLALFVTSSRAGEKNPPGDIPDDQVFVPYTSAAGGYSLKVPEGWAPSEKGSDVDFIDKFDGVAVIIVDGAATSLSMNLSQRPIQSPTSEFASKTTPMPSTRTARSPS